MIEGTSETERRPASLAPVSQRWPWITGGLALQLVGVAAPAVYVLEKAHKENVGGQITRATLRLAWHDSVHSRAGLALLVVGACIFVIGSVLLARPFVRRWTTLFIAVPIAALAGVLVLGAAAVVVALIIVAADDLFGGWIDTGSGGGGSSSSTRRKKRNDPPPD